MITDEEIEAAKKRTKYHLESQHHEHNDCIRIAYEWLDAQAKTKGITKRNFAIKHLIEKWAGGYISGSDVCVAAELHPEVRGVYPFFNISARLTEPSLERLSGISEAMKHDNYREYFDTSAYKVHE